MTGPGKNKIETSKPVDTKNTVDVQDFVDDSNPKFGHSPATSLEQESIDNKDGFVPKDGEDLDPTSPTQPTEDLPDDLKAARTGGITISERNALLQADPTLAPVPPVASKILDFLLPRKAMGRAKLDLDAPATQPSVFDIPELCTVYEPPDSWENKKNWDPQLRWTWREENVVLRKIDWNVFLWIALFFSILNLDRSNLSSANSANFLKDNHLTTQDFNDAQTIFYCTFLFAELPGQIISKRVGPDRFVPCQMIAWGIITWAQFWINGKTSFFVLRALLGLAQGSFIPDLLLLLSFFYRGAELTIRLSLFWVALNLTIFVSNYINLGFLQMHSAGHKPWAWMFFWQGILTIIAGFWALYVMPASPSQTKRAGKSYGFLNERQAKIAVARILRDEPQKSSMHNRQGLKPRMIWRTIKNWRLWPLLVIGISFGLPIAPIDSYLSLNLRGLGFSTVLTQTLTSVHNLVQCFTGLAVAILAETFNEKTLFCVMEDIWAWPCLVALVALPYGTSNAARWKYYAIVTSALSTPYVHAVQASWVSAISGDVATRTVATSLYNISVQITSILGSQIYRPSDAPAYRKGNAALLAVCTINFFLYAGAKIFYVTLNKRRDRVWGRMTVEQKAQYIKSTTDEGNERLDFRFVH